MLWLMSISLAIPGEQKERQSRSQLASPGQGKVLADGLLRLVLPSPLAGWSVETATEDTFAAQAAWILIREKGLSHPPAGPHTDLRKNPSEKLTSV